MSKRKAEENLTRFVWKRNPQYDIELLVQAEGFNPFAFNNQKPAWEQVAMELRQGELHMNVTDRSCRERVAELIKNHRKNELSSVRSSGTSDQPLTLLQTLLINVAKLQATKPDKKLKSLYSRNDKAEAEAERSRALETVNVGDSSDDSAEVEGDDNKDDFDFEHDSEKNRFQNSNPKRQLVKFLEKKNEGEVILRREELRIREKEAEIKAKEAEIKAKEVEVMRLKAENEGEERKKFMDVLHKLVENMAK